MFPLASLFAFARLFPHGVFRPRQVLAFLWAAVSLLAFPATFAATHTEAKTLRSIADIRSVNTWDPRKNHPLQLTGTLTLIDRERRMIVLQESTGAALALKFDFDEMAPPLGATITVDCTNSWPDLRALPQFPLNPSGRELLPSAKVPPERGANYISRLRGYLHPPTTGEYYFWIASDDTSELWLSSDDDPRSAQKIAAAITWTKPDEWNRRSAQKSSGIVLEAGRRYYIEAVHEQALGTDHLSIAWEGPGFLQQIIGGAFLSPWESPSAVSAHLDGKAPNTTRGSILREYWLERTVENAARLTAPRSLESTLVLVGATVRETGPAPLPQPQRVQPGQPCAVIDDFRWCEMEGNVEFIAYHANALVLELTDGSPRTRIVVKDAPRNWTQRFNGRRIRVQGVAEPALDAGNNRLIGTLWAQASIPPAIVEKWPQLSNHRAVTIAEVLSIDPQLFRNRAVKLRGRVMDTDGTKRLTLGDRSAFYGYISPDGSDWKRIGEPIEISMAESVHVGLMVSSRSTTGSTIAEFDRITGLGESLEGSAIGQPLGATSFRSAEDKLFVTGSGQDAWLGPDQFYFVHRPLTGAGTIIARVGQLTPTPVDRWAKAGLMIRESLAPDAPFVDLIKTGGSDIHFQWRNSADGEGPISVSDTSLTGQTWLKLERRYHTINVTTAIDEHFKSGQQIEVVGYVNLDGDQLAITDASCREIASENTQPNPAPAPDSRPLVELSRVRSAAGYTNLYDMLKVRAIVTFAGEVAGRRYVTIQDDSGAAFVFDRYIPDQKRYSSGNFVEVQSNPGWFAPSRDLNATNVFVLGEGAMPKPIHHPAEYGLPNRGEGSWLELEGIVRSVSRDGLMQLKQDGDVFTVAVNGVSAEKLRAYIDATLRVRGAIAYPTSEERLLLVPSEEQIEMIETAPPQPLVLPVRPIGELTPARVYKQSLHRVKLKGVVTWVDRDVVYFQDSSGGARVDLAESIAPKIGDVIEAVGFPDLAEDNSLILSHSLVRKVDESPPPVPKTVTTRQILSGSFGAQLIRVQALFSRDRALDGDHTLELQLDQRIFRASISSSSLPSIPPGSVVEVTGVCVLETALPDWIKVSAGSTSILPARLLLRSPDDLVVLSKPRWWAVKRTLVIGGVALAVFLMGVFWINLLRRRIAQRTAELRTTMEKLKKETHSAATLAERNRLAGEIHDSLEQGFSGVILQLDTTAKLGACPPDVRAGLTLARNMIAFSRNEVRHAVWDLQSPILENSDLGSAVKKILEQLAPETAQTTLAVEGIVRPMSSSVEHHLLRIAQEAITNAIKHAHPSHLDIVLTFAEADVTLMVRDDGRGFEPGNVLTGGLGHFGLRSLRGRAAKIHGELTISSKPGHGTTVEIRVPNTNPTMPPFL